MLKRFYQPLDFGKTYRGKPIFGANKTWLGLFSGIVMATLIIAIQKYLYARSGYFQEISWIDYQSNAVWLLGPLFGAGALLGDAVKSFFKRRAHVAPGNRWFPFDQIDFIIGGLLFSLPVVQLSPGKYALVLIVYFVGQMLTVYTGYLIGLREKPI
jgi:CDP-2,3-bis-(O-geranylgeranyl)-sn-glycerol synthase